MPRAIYPLLFTFLAAPPSEPASMPATAPALAVPSLEQLAWQDLEVGAFIHFAPNTWQDQEYDDLSTPLEKINPRQLNTDQWVHAAERMGARYIIFVAKHAGGFCMWQTRTTDYGIRNTPWRGGKRDVLRDLAYSCLRRRIRLGVYLSPQDRKHGAGVGGKCSTPEEQVKYNALYREQLGEVLACYPMAEVWFDGSTVVDVSELLKKLAPRAMIFQSPSATIRWVGNEDGVASDTLWNPVPRELARTGVTEGRHGDPRGDVWLPVECDARLRRDWFWNSRNASTLKSVDELMEMYYRSVGRGANLLLNLTPDTSGLIPQADVQRAAEFGNEVRRRFGAAVAAARGPAERLPGTGAWTLELSLPKPTDIDHVLIMEDIAHGQRIAKYEIQTWLAEPDARARPSGDAAANEPSGQWVRIAAGATIGHKKIDRLVRPVTVTRVRLLITSALAQPLIRRFAVHYAGPMPARYANTAPSQPD